MIFCAFPRHWLLRIFSACAIVCAVSACGQAAEAIGGSSASTREAPAVPGPLKEMAGPDARFDFYVLSLSWSPTYCHDAGEQADPVQCGRRRPFGFVAHGLWPQYEKGYPKDCDAGERSAPDAYLAGAMLDIMPSPGLIRHEWRAHGACSGLSAAEYFAAVRQAREKIKIPSELLNPGVAVTISPFALEQAFIRENNQLSSSGIAVTCSGQMLGDVRICLTKTLEFRTCSEVNSRACRRTQITAPAWRGG